MVKLPPINQNFLIHSIEYYEFNGNDDGWGDSHKEPITIKNVRVEPNTNLKITNNSVGVFGNSTLFVDRTNSTPFLILKENSKVIFDGKEYTIIKVNKFYDNDPVLPHHLEVGLE